MFIVILFIDICYSIPKYIYACLPCHLQYFQKICSDECETENLTTTAMLEMSPLIFFLLSLIAVSQPRRCQTELPQDDRRWMSTKTGYRQIVRNLRPDTLGAEAEAEGCAPLHLWTVVRHGTRYPSKAAIRLMTEDLPRLRDRILAAAEAAPATRQLCDLDLELLRGWGTAVGPEQAKLLHAEGDSEMILLGERWLDRLPGLLGRYEPGLYRLRSTDTERSQRSGAGFVTGLWTRVMVPRVSWHVVKDGHDPLIRFYKLCDAWIREVKKNREANIEKFKFEQSETMLSVEQSVTAYLGVNVTLSELDAMYVMCNFDLAWSPAAPSPWCRVFSDRDLRVMEYREDLEYYWVDGPGHEVTGKQACVLAKDMVDTFHNISQGHLNLNGSFYFTHSGTILKLLAFLGVFEDPDNLKSDNFDQMSDRKWKTSEIGPFGGNIAFVLQNCGDSGHKLGLFVNEQLTLIPGCDDVWCPLRTFVQNYPQVTSCDFDKICFRDDSDDESDVPDDKY